MPDLTEQDRKVLELYALGKGLRYIADELHIGMGAVRFHVRRLHNFFGTRNMSGLLPIAWKMYPETSEQ
jgi:DNA-binding NarL/FixJ family response regulator